MEYTTIELRIFEQRENLTVLLKTKNGEEKAVSNIGSNYAILDDDVYIEQHPYDGDKKFYLTTLSSMFVYSNPNIFQPR